MKTWTSTVIGALVVSILALVGYGAYTTWRLHKLEQRLDSATEHSQQIELRLQQVEANLEPQNRLLGSNGR